MGEEKIKMVIKTGLITVLPFALYPIIRSQ